MASESIDSIFISVPPYEQMSRVVRLATTAVASRLGLNIDQADDLSTAVDELFHVFLAQRAGKKEEFCLFYDIRDDRLEIIAKGCGSFVESGDNVGRYNRFLLEKLADSLDERPSQGGNHDIVLIKHLSNN